MAPRIGIDLGGTKIEGIVLDTDNQVTARLRMPSPHGDYEQTLAAVVGCIAELESRTGLAGLAVGLGIPGSISRATGRVHNANSTWLNGRDFSGDLKARLGRQIRIANDANCFALSEAADGAAAGAGTAFGVILGTGVGGGIVIRGAVVDGPIGIAGEWGHNPLPWALSDEHPGPRCWCGRFGCMEAWVSGPALAADHARATGATLSAEDIARAASAGDGAAQASLDRHASRLARGLAHVVNMIDPDVIVLGGGLSQLTHLYDVLPELVRSHVFADRASVTVKPPKWGDASGVRGAAWLAASA